MSVHTYLGGLELTVMPALLRLGEDAYGVPISEEIERQIDRPIVRGGPRTAESRRSAVRGLGPSHGRALG